MRRTGHLGFDRSNRVVDGTLFIGLRGYLANARFHLEDAGLKVDDSGFSAPLDRIG